MTRTDWIAAFVDELQSLRPHLAPSWGVSKIAQAIASQAYAAGPDVEPKAAAHAYHAAHPVETKERR